MRNQAIIDSPKATARMAGLMYVLLIPLGIMAMIYVPTAILVDDDIGATIANIKANEMVFRLASVAVYLTQLVNLYLVYLLYKLLSPVSKDLALAMVIFLVLAIPIAWLNELNNAAVLLLLDSPNPSTSLISMFLDLHAYGINIASIFWGLWLFPMGYLVFKSTFMPKIIGILLMIGCFGYLLDAFIHFMNPDFGFSFAEVMFVGELVMAFWLLFMGVNTEKWQQKRLEAQD